MNLSSAVWRKSTFSSANGCVEVAFLEDGVALRDSKHRDGAVLEFSPTEWVAFLRGVAAGEFEIEA
jgi:Domain of unknown function (DUF397)